MSQGPEHPDADSPAFVPSPNPDPDPDQLGMAPPSGAPDMKPATTYPASARESSPSLFSNAILMILGGALAAGGYGLARYYAPPRPPGEIAGPSASDAPKSDDFKALSERVDGLKASLDQVTKQMSDRPDPAPELKSQRESLANLTRTVGAMPARFDSMNQKLETVSKVEGTANSSTRVVDLDKKVSDLARSLENLKVDRGTNGSGVTGTRSADVNPEGLAIEQAADLYKAKKYAEAREAFGKLQATYPNDARVWYYSALANGFASGQWLGETERLVNLGLDKEKVGQPESSKVDALFTGLTPATGKDWLAGYRQRIGAR